MPNFFDEVDGAGIVETHIKQVLGLEQEQAKKVLENYSTIRQDLVDRLSRAPVQSFTAQHLRGVLGQVQGAIEALNSSLAGNMTEGALAAAKSGITGLVDQINLFDEKFTGAVTPINLNASMMARDTANFLVTKYETNLDAYGNDLYKQIANGLFRATIGDTSYSQVVGSISQFFTAEEWKLHRIVRTELHNIFNMGKIQGMRELGGEDGELPDLMKTLMHPMDQRTGEDSKYLAQLSLALPIDEPFVYEWKGKTREFMAPPDRPNDRAILVPYRVAWGATRGPAFITAKFPEA